MKRILSLVLTITLLLSLAISVTSCKKNTSENLIKKPLLAIGRVLVLIQVGVASLRQDKHTPKQKPYLSKQLNLINFT